MVRDNEADLDRVRNIRGEIECVQGAVFLRKATLESINSSYANS